MRSKGLTSNLVLMLVAVMALSVLCTTCTWAQTLSNGNFESWTGGINVADNWTQYIKTGTLACYKGSTFGGTPSVSPHGGSECQRVKLAGSNYEGGVYQRFGSTAGTQYTVTAYLLTRLTSTTEVEAKLGVDPSGATAPGGSTSWSATVTGDSSWTARTVTVAATGSYVTVFLDGRHPASGTSQCNVFFDDASVEIYTPPTVVTITPSNMADYGWATATSNGGTANFTVGGPVASEYAGTPTWPMGRGGFYATCDEISGDGSTPSTVWLGLDKLYVSPGVFKSLELIRLDQIKKIVSKTYVPAIPTWHCNISEMNYPMQPIRVAIATAKDQPPGYLNRRWYVNMPWPYSWNVFHTQTEFAQWRTNSAAPWNGTTAGWYCANLAGIAPYYGKWDKWEDLVTEKGGEILVPTSTFWDPSWPKDPLGWKSCGYCYDPGNPSGSTNPPGAEPATGTGKALNFWVGARDEAADLTAWYNVYFAWWQESYGFRGCLDAVTIGVDFGEGNGGYVETTYDFEPDPGTPDIKTVALAEKGATLPTGTGVWRLNPIMQSLLINRGYSGADRQAMRVRVVGRVISYSTHVAFGDHFDLDDGSVLLDTENYDPPYPWDPEKYEKELAPAGLNLWYRPLPVRVHVPTMNGDRPYIGEWWAVTGYPVVLGWDHPIPDPQHNATEVCGQLYLYSNVENCHLLHY